MVVFFDIDGTVVDNDTQVIPESAVRAVAALRQRGHIPVVNTGRPYSHIDPRIRAMDFSAYICACGMEILLGDRWLTRQQPAPEVCRAVRDAVRQCRMQVLYEADAGRILTDGQWSAHPAAVKEAAQMTAKGFEVREIDSLPEPQFMKLVNFETPESHREEYLRLTAPWFDCIDRVTLLELVLKGCSKAGGMALLLEHLGISREDTLAIGDSTNDLPMFRAAKHTVCMGNGMEELKREAEYITASVLEDGLEKALRHFGLL